MGTEDEVRRCCDSIRGDPPTQSTRDRLANRPKGQLNWRVPRSRKLRQSLPLSESTARQRRRVQDSIRAPESPRFCWKCSGPLGGGAF